VGGNFNGDLKVKMYGTKERPPIGGRNLEVKSNLKISESVNHAVVI